MGKRKKAAKKPGGPKKNAPLPSAFDCLFCNHVSSVVVKLDKKVGVGDLSCKVCSQEFQCAINYLSAAVDVYSDWIDACDTVAKGDGKEIDVDEIDRDDGERPQARPVVAGGRPRARPRHDEDANIINNADAEDDLGGHGGKGVVADDEY